MSVESRHPHPFIQSFKLVFKLQALSEHHSWDPSFCFIHERERSDGKNWKIGKQTWKHVALEYRTPLRVAAMQDSIDIVKLVFKLIVSLLTSLNGLSGAVARHMALRSGFVGTIEWPIAYQVKRVTNMLTSTSRPSNWISNRLTLPLAMQVKAMCIHSYTAALQTPCFFGKESYEIGGGPVLYIVLISLQIMGAGGFHPAGNEGIINSKVWDLRKFRFLWTVPSLDQRVITFNSHGVEMTEKWLEMRMIWRLSQ